MVESVYFTSLEIENVRCFGDLQKLDLTVDGRRPARWTLILGDNGVGKTTLLECLTWMRLEPSGFDPALFDKYNDYLERLLPVGRSGDLSLSAEISVGSSLSMIDDVPKMLSRRRPVKANLSILVNPKGELANRKFSRNPQTYVDSLVVAYGANRQRGFQNLAKSELLDSIGTRLTGYTELYDNEQMLRDLYSESEIRKRSKRARSARADLVRLKNVIVEILPVDIDPDAIRIYPPDNLGRGEKSGVYLKTFSGEVPFSELSLGYRTTLAWTADFAWRLMQHYEKSKDPFAEPAVVLIDEIDLHLHPRWQLSIMKNLAKVFPATQFIATSHSPLMAQVAESANFVLLNIRQDENDVKIENDPEVVKGWRVDQILTSELFGGIGSRSAKTEQLFVDRDALLSKRTPSEEDEAELHRLRMEIERLPIDQFAGDRDSITMIRETAALLRRHQRGAE